jgi:hypothetical protein
MTIVHNGPVYCCKACKHTWQASFVVLTKEYGWINPTNGCIKCNHLWIDWTNYYDNYSPKQS